MFPLLEAASTGFAQLGMALGAGLATIGAGLGIGKIGSSAMELSHASLKHPVRS